MSDKYETKDFTGALFRNDKKETDSHPDYKGSAVINGTDMWVSAWINTSAKGVKYMSLKFNEKEAVHNAGMTQAKKAAEPAPMDDLSDIPFNNHEYRTFA